MLNTNRPRIILLSLFILVTLFSAGIPRPNFSQSRSAQRPPDPTQGADPTHASGQGQKHRPDPCDPEFPSGNAYGLRKKCVRGGSGGVSKGDFNNDGFADLAVGVPNEDVGSIQDAGAVQVIYGSATGLSATAGPGNQLWTENNIGVGGGFASVAFSRFGTALASGDFNGDGFSDLAIGDPLRNLRNSTIPRAGAVFVLYGSPNGLTSAGSQVFYQGLNGLAEQPEADDHFGQVLNWGNFNGDSFADLVVGVPDEDVDAGVVQVIYGSQSGLTAAGNQLWSQDSEGVLDAAETFDGFGSSLAVGDFDGNGKDDLAVGVPFEDVTRISSSGISTVTSAGAVSVLYGTANGLSDSFNQLWTQESSGILDAAEGNDHFGLVLTAGDFNGDGKSDLAIDVPREDLGSIASAGAVNVIYGSSARLSASAGPGNQFWTQDSPFILDAAEAGDHFGSALAAGDFNGDGFADLAVGVPDEDVGAVSDAGAVNVIYGSSSGLSATTTLGQFKVLNNQFWTEDTNGVSGEAEDGDSFGTSLTAWNFGNSPPADLVIGIPAEDVPNAAGTNVKDAGAVLVLYGRPIQPNVAFGGLSATDNFVFTQNTPGILEEAEPDDRFGTALY